RRRRHTRSKRDWSSDVCSSDLIGEAGNWSEPGKLDYGLQKLVPVGDDTFDMHEVRLTDNGFEISYTQPLSQETVENIAEAYTVSQCSYVPTPAYGRPKNGEDIP